MCSLVNRTLISTRLRWVLPGTDQRWSPGAAQALFVPFTCGNWKHNALDNIYRSVRTLATRNGHVVHHGWPHPHSSSRGVGYFCDQFVPRETVGLAAGVTIMKPLIWGGILFIVLGGFALAYRGFNYTHEDKVLDVGPIHATADKHEHVNISPLLGGLALVGGVIMLVVGVRQKS